MRTQICFLILIPVCCSLATNAHGGIPIPIIWGSGEKMTEMGELPPDVSTAVANELETRVTVAFLHERAHLFYLDIWTWNGRYVLHSGDQYWELDSDQWRDLIGEDPSEKYSKPFLYKVPLLPVLIGLVAIAYVVRKRFFKTEEEKLQLLLKDVRYQKALELIFGREDETSDSDQPATTLDEQKFLSAKTQLIGEGVPAHLAESNLRKLVTAIIASTNEELDEYLEVASQLEAAEEWDKSAEVYRQLISLLPDSDVRKLQAQECLTNLERKLEHSE